MVKASGQPKRAAPEKSARNEGVYQAMRGDILSGRVRPGQRLPYADLADRYGNSVGVIRESLLRLVEQGLVEQEAQQGFRVTSVSREDLLELTEARREIEGLALRYAVSSGDVQWESRLLAAHHILERTPQKDPDDPDRFSEVWAEAHRDFHKTMLEGCPNSRIVALANGLRDSAELYRRWSVPVGHDEKRDIPAEHKGMLDAVLARDTELAVQLMVAHIDRTTQVLITTTDEVD